MKAIKADNIQATIHRNFRYTMSSPKVLLTNIIGFDRDHCWVSLTDELEKFVPITNKNKRKIQFDCKLSRYFNYLTGEEKWGIINLKNIQQVYI